MVFLLSTTIGTFSANAQLWKRIQQKVEDKVNRAVDKTVDKGNEKVDNVVDGALNGKKDAKENSGSGKSRNIIEEEAVYSFVPGTRVVFQDNFQTDTEGRMPKYWKSSGGGSVVRLKGIPGNWLGLAARTTYRIDSLLDLSGRFTVEFDVLTSSEAAKDIGQMSVGFARDNSSRSYIMDAYNDNAITSTTLHFWNKEIVNSSSDTKIYNTVEYPLNNYANNTLHIAIEVDGKHMLVFADKHKLLDADMFDEETKKYFYLSAPFEYASDAKVYLGNIVIAH